MSRPTSRVTGERAVPYHCPYCAEEDLRPLGATPGAWHCRTCTRSFSVRYLGTADPSPTPTWSPTPQTLTTGGTP
jgi:transposase-like protein